MNLATKGANRECTETHSGVSESHSHTLAVGTYSVAPRIHWLAGTSGWPLGGSPSLGSLGLMPSRPPPRQADHSMPPVPTTVTTTITDIQSDPTESAGSLGPGATLALT
jgi:hypothetical protein